MAHPLVDQLRFTRSAFLRGLRGVSEGALSRVLEAWRAITSRADPWLDGLVSADLERHIVSGGQEIQRRYGDLLQRLIYHSWFHAGENAAIRQQLGHDRLPRFVGSIDRKAPYRPDP